MKNYLVIGIAAVLIVSTGVVHGIWNGTGAPSEQLQVFAKRLDNVPLQVGDWNGEELTAMDPREKFVAGADGALQRSYQNLKTKERSALFIVSGHFRDVAKHTPDQCYVAAGFEMMGKEIKYLIPTPDGTVEAYTTVFKKEDHTTGTQYQRVFWTWAHDGNWVAPDMPLFEFVGQSALYKMYIISSLPPGKQGRSITEDPSLGFAHDLIPTLNKALFPKVSSVGSDPADALEPAAPTTEPTPDAAPPVEAAPTAASAADFEP